jgi:hypothetical protein
MPTLGTDPCSYLWDRYTQQLGRSARPWSAGHADVRAAKDALITCLEDHDPEQVPAVLAAFAADEESAKEPPDDR